MPRKGAAGQTSGGGRDLGADGMHRRGGKLGIEVWAFLCVGDLVLFLKSGKATGFVTGLRDSRFSLQAPAKAQWLLSRSSSYN